jgi:hypothetical protein
MNPLTKTVHRLLSQDVARHNAATATSRVMRERQQRADVAAYLEQVDTHPPSPPPTSRNRGAGQMPDTVTEAPGWR